jgi:hypothetical protein
MLVCTGANDMEPLVDADAHIKLEELLICKNQNRTKGRKPVLGISHEDELSAI